MLLLIAIPKALLPLLGLQSRFGGQLGKKYLEFEWILNLSGLSPKRDCGSKSVTINSDSTGTILPLLGLQSRFRGQLEKNYLEFEWIVPKTGL